MNSGHQVPRRWANLLNSIADDCEALNELLATGEIDKAEIRSRVQNIHALAVTPQVEEWDGDE